MDSIDHDKHRAYVLSVEADELLAQHDVSEARKLMLQAAELDAGYAVRAELAGQPDPRPVRVSATVRKLLIPWLSAQGFQTDDGAGWKEGRFLKRSRGTSYDSMLIGRAKFGHGLGMLVARIDAGNNARYYDFRTINLRSGVLAYKTQRELEAVCARWRVILEEHVFRWLDATDVVQRGGASST